MPFYSLPYAFVLLPAALAGFALLKLFTRGWPALLWLTIVSLIFYGWWNPHNLIVLGSSIAVNFAIVAWLASAGIRRKTMRKALVSIGIGANIGVLCFFKYSAFITAFAARVTGWELPEFPIVLPLGISFFTFQQITYLVDAYRAEIPRYSFLDYSLFVSFFPHIIAGPISRHDQLIPQFHRYASGFSRRDDMIAGVTYFAMGLFKKSVLVTLTAKFSDPVFAAAANGGTLSFVGSWIGAVAYALQIYFDFSAYSDMAIGSARFFGVFLPYNFFSPYKSRNIAEFWRRWHMSLSRFFRDYLYIPLGGNRKGRLRQALNGLITMILVGVWHGSSWNFVVWGALHGVFLAIFHSWQIYAKRIEWIERSILWKTFAGMLTFVSVVGSFVVFRAESLPAAAHVLRSMFAVNFSSIAPFAIVHNIFFSAAAGLLPFAIIWLLPNSHEWIDGRHPAQDAVVCRQTSWPKATFTKGMIVGSFLVLSLLFQTHVKEFIYFQF